MSALPITPASVDRLLTTLSTNPSHIAELIAAIPGARLRERPAAGKWSAHEHACHLAVVHGIMEARLDRMLREDDPVFHPYLPGEQEDDDALLKLDLEISLAAYRRDRQALVERLRALPLAAWARTGRHPEYASYSIYIMYRHIALHDLLHGYRIEEILLAPVS